MTRIVSINPDLMEYLQENGHAELRLILTDTDGQQHSLVLEKTALGEFLMLFRALQAQFPGDLGVH